MLMCHSLLYGPLDSPHPGISSVIFHLRVAAQSTADWAQVGPNIFRDGTTLTRFESMAMSGDGKTIAVGEQTDSFDAGYIRLHQLDSSDVKNHHCRS